ncbi:tricalbin-3-like [Andrographis paniculata]|uniref:tricalbin-3-like n=1 Tax=Andrographis paniculata TaxID=175694 RepID=UPI0021E74FFD|nr:tricalbin-3-like [Andrographis paniculata]XP_051144933.1 tricalbin-3-like [Andrographis paniculata]
MFLQPPSEASLFNCVSSPRKSLLFSPSLIPSISRYNSKSRPFSGRREAINLKNVRRTLLQAQACKNGGNKESSNKLGAATRRGAEAIVLKRFSSEKESNYASLSSTNTESGSYYNSAFEQDPIVDKLRNQLGVIHPIPSPPINRNILGLFVVFFFIGVVSDKLWTSRKRGARSNGNKPGSWPQVPTGLSIFLEKELQRKESVEWVNMVLGKLWKVYRGGIENWLIGLLQPVIDNLKKPDYVQRVEIKQFSLGDEPLSVRSVERRTSRRVNDLQYQIGLRYAGGARMLLLLSLKFGIFPIVVPVGVRDFDIDGELWVKLRLIPTEPWVGAVSWAFVSLPKIKFELSPFRLFNLMEIPVLSLFLKKLLTEDLPKLFVRPKKIVLDFQKGMAVGPVTNDPKPGDIHEGNNDFAGELSVTLLDARKLTYIFYGKTDPYVILRLGDQVIRSKRNSQTTVIGPPGEPIWNQDFHMLVVNPMKERLYIEVKDSLGFTDSTIGAAEVDLGSLKDTVPADRIVQLRGWNPFGKGSVGEILLRLTYKAYVEDEEDERSEKTEKSEDELTDLDEPDMPLSDQRSKNYLIDPDKESFINVLADILVSEEFQGIVASETVSSKPLDAGADSKESSRSNVGSIPQALESGADRSQGSTTTTMLFWLALITGALVLIATSMEGTSLFNP